MKNNKTRSKISQEFKELRNKVLKHMSLLIILVVFFFILGSLNQFRHSPVDAFSSLFVVVGTLYFMVLLFALMIKSIKTLLTTSRFLSLVEWYVVFTLAFIISIALVHSAIDGLELGSLKQSDGTSIQQNNFGSYLYFTSITYFSVGYGDISPVGVHRGLAVFNVLVGHLFNLIIMAVAISNFMHNHKTGSRS